MTGDYADRFQERRLGLVIRDCADQCSAGVRAKLWLYIGSVRGTGSGDQGGARAAFEQALKLDPSLAPDSAYTNDETKATYWMVRAGMGLAPDTQSAARPPAEPATKPTPAPPPPGRMSRQVGEVPDRAGPELPEAHRPRGFLLGVYATGFVPFGDWSRNLISRQTMFGPGAGGTVEIGGKVRRLTLTAQFDITSMYVGGWERYAAKHGSSISASAYQLGFYNMASFDLWRWDASRLEFRTGIGYMQAFGSEHDDDYGLTYHYGFLEPSLALRAGLGGAFRLFRSGELLVFADQQVGIPGAEYADETRVYLGLSVSIGVRLWPWL